ncbi:hypothetical protein [Enterovirga aerilata]|uniref:hypothetical protein n=1 Tax=Enterovirga aerilata TaxID=2730920 RepID=UPI001AEE783C|nr:hypothetical protein [Enterovirga sp. DB1703]
MIHDDDEERFPRITLWQFLGGVFTPLANVWLWLEGWRNPFDRHEGSSRVTWTLVLIQIALSLCAVSLILIFAFDRQSASMIALAALAVVLAFLIFRARLRKRS